jgi:hypothetical protein
MLTGVSVCGVCGGSMRATIRGTGSGARRKYVPNYTCATFETRATCTNSVVVRTAHLERAVLERIGGYLDASITSPAIDRALARLVGQRGPDADRRVLLGQELDRLEARGRRLATAISDTDAWGELVAELEAVRQQKATVQAEIATLSDTSAPPDADVVKAELVGYARDVRALLAGTPDQARTILRQLLRTKILMEPFRSGTTRGYRFSGELQINRLLAGETRVSAQTRAGC